MFLRAVPSAPPGGRIVPELAGSTPERDRVEAELRRLRAEISRLERHRRQLEDRLSSASEPPPPISTPAELEATLRTFVKKVAMILQADKCVIMLINEERGELVAETPAHGITDDEARQLRIPSAEGLSGEVFQSGKARIVADCIADPIVTEPVALLKLHNAVSVPLVLERRGADESATIRKRIGVLHAFNKRRNEAFNEDDIRLLTVLARSAAAVISNARLMIRVSEEKRRLEETLHSMMAGVVVLDADGKIMLINHSARGMFGLSADGYEGRTVAEVVQEHEVAQLLTQTLQQREEQRAEVTLFHPQQRIYQVQTGPVKGNDGALVGVVATLMDITELRNVERMKTEFVSSVSHELRTPLTSIKGFIRTLLEDEEGYYDRETQREFYQVIDSECDRLVRLIGDLLNVARIESGRALQVDYSEVDLTATLGRITQVYQSTTQRHVFVKKLPDHAVKIDCDADKIEQVINNLLSNAVKYSPDGGTISVGLEESADRIAFWVSDQGIGIPEEHLDKIFLQFHRVEDHMTMRAGGAGIGLYLVQALVKAHGGDITVQSKLGQGSAFRVELPKKAPAAAPA